jgi:4-carboxymuconolactone decarboxylase
MSAEEKVLRGRDMRRRAQGSKADLLGEALGELDPALLEWTDSFIFGDLWTRPGLDYEERMLVAITSLATQGHLPQLRNYLHGALQAGIRAEKVHETLLMTCVYAGFPTALNALTLFKEVVAAEARRTAAGGGEADMNARNAR